MKECSYVTSVGHKEEKKEYTIRQNWASNLYTKDSCVNLEAGMHYYIAQHLRPKDTDVT